MISFLELMKANYSLLLIAMSVLAPIVFVTLYFIKAGYGQFRTKGWGYSINNRVGWVLMEAPVFLLMTLLCLCSDRCNSLPHLVLFSLFQLHYFQRTFIFSFLIKGRGKIPLTIILMGVFFNVINAIMQGGWIFYISPTQYYNDTWLVTPQFIIGTILFFAGMGLNIQSDTIIRRLCKSGGTKHYIPKGGLFKYVSSANYFGEILEWVGFAILTWSLSGAVFVLWTITNITPRAAAIYKSYTQKFGTEYTDLKLKRVFPFIY